MAASDRDDLIDAYFDAMDEEDLSILRPGLADDFVYESLSGDLEGFEGIQRYMDELRGLANTTHEVTLRVHGENASAAEGIVAGDTTDGGTVEAEFCNVFEFDAGDEHVTRIGVYLNDS